MDSSPSQVRPLKRPKSARSADIMLAQILTTLITCRSCSIKDVRESLPIGKVYYQCMESLEAAGLVKPPAFYDPKYTFGYSATVDRVELARQLHRVMARIEKAEGGATK